MDITIGELRIKFPQNKREVKKLSLWLKDILDEVENGDKNEYQKNMTYSLIIQKKK